MRTPEVYICHSPEDKQKARQLCKRMKADGFTPLLDDEFLLPGQDWRAVIQATVRTCDAVIVCLSQASINEEGFVNRKIKDALDTADEKPEGTIFIIPVRFDQVEVPQRFGRWYCVDLFNGDLFNEDGYFRLIAALRPQALGHDLTKNGMSTQKSSRVTGISLVRAPHITKQQNPRHALGRRIKAVGADLGRPVPALVSALFLCVVGLILYQDQKIDVMRKPQVESHYFLGGRTRGEQGEKSIVVHKGVPLSLTIEFTPSSEFKSYQAKILSDSGKIKCLIPLNPQEGDVSVSIMLSSEALEQGKYSVVILGEPITGPPVSVGGGLFNLQLAN